YGSAASSASQRGRESHGPRRAERDRGWARGSERQSSPDGLTYGVSRSGDGQGCNGRTPIQRDVVAVHSDVGIVVVVELDGAVTRAGIHRYCVDRVVGRGHAGDGGSAYRGVGRVEREVLSVYSVHGFDERHGEVDVV